jgi:hypothetical protein
VIVNHERCIKLLVTTAVKRLKYHSNPMENDLFIAKSVIANEDQEDIDHKSTFPVIN